MGTREGLLSPEYRDWYPRLVPGVWYRASWLVEDVLDQQRSGGPSWALDDRVLSGNHFVFRGGRLGSRPRARMRRADRLEAAPRSRPPARRRHIREEVARLIRSALGPPSGARPRRFYLTPHIADALLALASAAGLKGDPAGPWYVVEGRHRSRRRGSSGRVVPLVCREGAALVVETWQGARALAALLNWCDVPPPPRPAPPDPGPAAGSPPSLPIRAPGR